MYNEGRKNRRLYVASHTQDIPRVGADELIPTSPVLWSAPSAEEEILIARSTGSSHEVWFFRPALLITFSVLLFAVSIGSAGYSVFRAEQSAAAYASIEEATIPFDPEPFQYGRPIAAAYTADFMQAKQQLLASSTDFIEIDLEAMQLQVYHAGAVLKSFSILSKGEKGSWWQVTPGVYTIDNHTRKRYSSFGNIYLPWSLSFEGNFYINGIPEYRDGSKVPEEYRGGGIRLSDTDAEALYELTGSAMPVLVHEQREASDDFVYEAKIPGVQAQHYLVADLKSSTVLAASDLTERAPIASLTKLMTALVAAEHTDLDRVVYVHEGIDEYISSLVPRLTGGYQVSMYSLLQLLLLESSNEAAEVIADTIGRSDFMQLMNDKASALGLLYTHFTDPAGLESTNESSVGDIFRLVQYIYENRGFILELTHDQYLSTAYTSGQFGQLNNFNEIEGVDFIAGKVGETEAAGLTSVTLHTLTVYGEERVIAIVLLNTDDRRGDVKRIFEYVKVNFEAGQL